VNITQKLSSAIYEWRAPFIKVGGSDLFILLKGQPKLTTSAKGEFWSVDDGQHGKSPATTNNYDRIV
jgi:hypothetical protein